jgi:hypothetical protein
VSTKTTAQKLARALQRVAEDEIKARPALTTCANIVREDSDREDGHVKGESLEEKACRLFEKWRDRLEDSARRKTSREL